MNLTPVRTSTNLDEFFVVGLLRSLNMNTAQFALSQLQEYKLCFTSKTHKDVTVLVVEAMVMCLAV